MTILVCKSCGSTDIIKQDDYFVCRYCGAKYSPDMPFINNLYALATDAYESGNYAGAEGFCNKVLELNCHHADAAFLKGKAVGWQTTVANNRFQEAAICFANAVNSSNTPAMTQAVESEFINLTNAIIRLRLDRFSKWPDEEEASGFCSDCEEVLTALQLFTRKTGKIIIQNRIFSNTVALVSSSISHIITSKIITEYKNSGGREAFRLFAKRIDCCICILEKATELCDNDGESDVCIFELIISLLNMVIQGNCSDYIRNRWMAYDQIPRLSEFEINAKQRKIREITEKMNSLKRG